MSDRKIFIATRYSAALFCVMCYARNRRAAVGLIKVQPPRKIAFRRPIPVVTEPATELGLVKPGRIGRTLNN